MKVGMITTTDNPFDPFTQFEDWYAFDEQHGYHTCSILARLTNTSPELSVEQMNEDNEEAIAKMLRFNFFGNYKRVEM